MEFERIAESAVRLIMGDDLIDQILGFEIPLEERQELAANSYAIVGRKGNVLRISKHLEDRPGPRKRTGHTSRTGS